ncbi:MAG TPA: hypothetical protein VMQ11_01730 [Alphaproteobacteria bacterium]|nr:hypothetical protein [Alphaproteobacteria bacterium]
MLIRTLIAAAAVVGLMSTGAVTTTAFAQTSQPANTSMPMKSMPMKKGSAMHSGMHKGGMAKEGHKMDHVADKLNACQAKPAAERQSCMDSATKM